LDIESISEVDFSGELRPQILADITKEEFDDQLVYLAKKLDSENEELLNLLKAKEAEQKAKKASEKKKRDRQVIFIGYPFLYSKIHHRRRAIPKCC
jgi:hypothetical protein